MRKVLLTTGMVAILLYGGAVYANTRHHSVQNPKTQNEGYCPYHGSECQGYHNGNMYYHHETSDDCCQRSNSTTNYGHHGATRNYNHHSHRNHH